MSSSLNGIVPGKPGRRILCVANKYPLPADSGSRQRLWHLVKALSAYATVDVFILGSYDEKSTQLLQNELPTSRITAITPGPVRSRWLARLEWLSRNRRPSTFVYTDHRPAHRHFKAWRAERYDLAWYFGCSCWDTLGPQVNAPSIIDLADLPHMILRRTLSEAGSGCSSISRKERLRMRLDEIRWEKYIRLASQSANAIAVCSQNDMDMLGVSNAIVVPNGIDMPDAPLGRSEIGAPPRILFPGRMTYGPNIEGARWLINEIVPIIRRRHSNLEVTIVGEHGPDVAQLAGPGIHVPGYLPRMEMALELTDIVAVPLSVGSGTRIKILEAWSHAIPVVSTRVGAEGLEAQDGVHLLLADNAEDFANACIRLFDDDKLRNSVRLQGLEHVKANFTWAKVGRILSNCAEQIIEQGSVIKRLPSPRNNS